MGIGMLLFWGAIIFAIAILARGFAATSGSSANAPVARDKTPLDMLGERYARGEIGQAEFEQKRDDLKGTSGAFGDKDRAARNVTGAHA